MGPSATIVADSISPEGIRLTSFHLHYWRPIHSELMTHRVFSRNARSSRAVPVTTLLKEQVFIPEFMMNKPGMQASEFFPPEKQKELEDEWAELALITRRYVEKWSTVDHMHKQWANRPLEWFGWIDVLVTSTDWANFYALRCDAGAQPELRVLAEMMKDAHLASKPRELKSHQWHLPYVTEKEQDGRWGLEPLLKLSTARCARISYKPFDGSSDLNAEMDRHDKLVVNRPVHASPAEHQATPDRWLSKVNHGQGTWENPELHGNFRGWVQYRKTLPNEFVKD